MKWGREYAVCIIGLGGWTPPEICKIQEGRRVEEKCRDSQEKRRSEDLRSKETMIKREKKENRRGK